jgi:hypothetical protein
VARRSPLLVAGALSIIGSAHPAMAQTAPSLDARTWSPSTDAQTSLILEPVTSPGPWQWNVAAWASYAHEPVAERDGAGHVVARPVAHQVLADFTAGMGLGDRFAIGLDLPVLLWQDGASNLPAAVVGRGAARQNGIGDLALLGKATLLSNDRGGLHAGAGAALTAEVTFPTGDRSTFLSDGAVTASLRILGEYALGAASIRASLGFEYRPDSRRWPADATGIAFGNAVPWALGLTVRPKAFLAALDSDDRQIWELALHGSLPAGPVAPFGLGRTGASDLSPVLLALDDRVALAHTRDFYLLAGVEAGLDQAFGVPAFRGVLGFGWAPRSHDRDGDGVPDDVDQCPDLPEDRDGIQDQDGCPEDDADGDGVPDDQDACPLKAGVPSGDPHRNGCPP